ncbi:DNA replication ATP-dependent helicase/nuclease DNA2 [Danaus plexippus]|uniref:DNA replication ATP-dependent helicase/nuclease DNA2 n=1 Tax=Danaus plexippus TaxID=13037 RepID=UPI002AB0219E|nr:DNA replication ATP-dependent helicase/nuclease DNA2 [Danaus plexippus]
MQESSSSKKKSAPNKQQTILNFFGNASDLNKTRNQEACSEGKSKTLKRKAHSPSKIHLDSISHKVTGKFSSDNNTTKKLRMDTNTLNDLKGKHIEHDAIKVKSPKKKNILSCKSGLSLNKESNVENISKHYELESMNQKENICNRKIEITCSSTDLSNDPNISQNDINSQPSHDGSSSNEQRISRAEIDDIFIDDFDLEDIKDDLDLTTMQRCKILDIIKHPQSFEIILKNNINNRGTVFIEGNWLNTYLQTGDIVSILASRDSSGRFRINNTQGLLVLRPDHLISSTSVVSGVFCRRKAVLQERWKGIDSASVTMTIGTLVHEMVQRALTQKISNVPQIKVLCENIIKESIEMLFDAGITEADVRTNMQVYLEPLAEFMQMYVVNDKMIDSKKYQWKGKVEKVLDIEENVCCPQMGLKGKIDATLEVTIHNRKDKTTTVPLELKSGRASVSAEHTGQLVLYGMMMSVLEGKDPARGDQRGLLLYLKDKINITEVNCDYPERRDLVMLRNELVQHLAAGPNDTSQDELTDIEDLGKYHQSLPEPVNHHSACSKCAYLTLCSLHLWHTNGPTVPSGHPLSKLKSTALGHLSSEHIQYFLKWASLLRVEEKMQLMTSPIHALWTDSTDIRSKRGSCAPNLTLSRVSSSNGRYLHVFIRNGTKTETLSGTQYIKGPQAGDFSIVSIDNRPWVAAGAVTLSDSKELQILLDRDLSLRLSRNTKYHIDIYESYATTVQNLTNLGLLMEDTHQASKLRKLIIDKESPTFTQKLPPRVHKLSKELLVTLNEEQQAAVLRVLECDDYVLLQGLPGTGKTQTLCALIQLLCSLGMRVLVTAHTHSAVDTLLSRLPSSLKVLRVGTSSRVSVSAAVKECTTVEQLTNLYNSVQVVGVTCLGASHALLSKNTFDFCIVDEATQVLQSTVLRPLFAANKFVLVGDPEQLPPVVRSRDAKFLGMEVSLFHSLMKDRTTCTLSLQYRMNQPLADLANKIAYSNRLKCANETVAKAALNINKMKLSESSSDQWITTVCSPEPEDAAVFLNTKMELSEDASKTLNNKDEAVVVLAVIKILKQAGISASDIGVIAPYRDQVTLLKRVLDGTQVEASTVDQFQGRDKSVIIYSCTRKDDNLRKVKENEVLNDKRRLAVSVTRAKHKFIVIGNIRALKRYTTIMKLEEACKTVDLDEEVVTNLNNKYGF